MISIMQLWWSFFQIFVNGDVVVDVQTSEVLTLKNTIEPS